VQLAEAWRAHVGGDVAAGKRRVTDLGQGLPQQAAQAGNLQPVQEVRG
jgi:hypothetical protein